MEKQSFSKFLESKKQLLEAITRDPIVTQYYEINKYCKIQLGESHNMRPHQKIAIRWKYQSVDIKPIPLEISLSSDNILSEMVDITNYYDSSTLFKWLNSNAREIKRI